MPCTARLLDSPDNFLCDLRGVLVPRVVHGHDHEVGQVGGDPAEGGAVERNASGPTERKWSKRAGRVTTCETLSHHAGRSTGRGGAPASWPCRLDDRPANPTAPNTTQHPRRRLERAITASLRILSATE